MIIACPACLTQFQVDSSKLSPTGTKVRCAKCKHTWVQSPREAPVRPREAPVRPSEAPRPREIPRRDTTTFDTPFVAPNPPPAPVPSFDAGADESPSAYIARGGREEDEPRRGVGVAAWGSLVGLIALLVAGAYFFRVDIVRAWPRSAAAYDLLHIGVNTVGIDFRNVSLVRNIELGSLTLELQGELVNQTKRRLAVPKLAGRLRDGKKQVLYDMTFEAFAKSLGPKEVSAFSYKVINPPLDTKDVELTFVSKK